MCKLPAVAVTNLPKGDEHATVITDGQHKLAYRPRRSLIVVDEDHEVAVLREALEVIQAQLRKTEQELEAKQLECEQLHFRLQAVSFGSHSFAHVDKEWECEQRDNPWTRSRVEHAVETRNTAKTSVGGIEPRISLHLRKPLVTVIPLKRSSRKKGNRSVGAPSATCAKRHVQSALKRESCYAGSQLKKRKGKVVFADDEAIFARCPVCVDDYELNVNEELDSNNNEKGESKQDDADAIDGYDDDFAMDIVDRWTSTLDKCSARIVSVELFEQKDEETKQNDNVKDWMCERVPSLRTLIINKKAVATTSAASAAGAALSRREILEC